MPNVDLHELHRAMGRVESKMDLVLERTAGHEKRLSKVERMQWWASGAVGVVAFFAAKIGIPRLS